MKRRLNPVLMAALIGAAVGAILTGRLKLRGLRLPEGNQWYSGDDKLIAHWPFLLVSVLAWSLLSIYREAAAKKASAAKSSESQSSRGVHVFLVNAAMLLVLIPIRGWGRFEPALPAIMAAGLAIQALGILLAVWARVHLGRNWSGAISIKVEHQLVRSGPYRLLRHPIYTGLLTMYLGTALTTGEWHAALGVALAVFAYWRKIRLEEATMDTAFGAAYETYRRSTWALIPGMF